MVRLRQLKSTGTRPKDRKQRAGARLLPHDAPLRVIHVVHLIEHHPLDVPHDVRALRYEALYISIQLLMCHEGFSFKSGGVQGQTFRHSGQPSL